MGRREYILELNGYLRRDGRYLYLIPVEGINPLSSIYIFDAEKLDENNYTKRLRNGRCYHAYLRFNLTRKSIQYMRQHHLGGGCSDLLSAIFDTTRIINHAERVRVWRGLDMFVLPPNLVQIMLGNSYVVKVDANMKLSYTCVCNDKIGLGYASFTLLPPPRLGGRQT